MDVEVVILYFSFSAFPEFWSNYTMKFLAAVTIET